LGVAAPAQVEDFHGAGRLDLPEVDLRRDDDLGPGQLAQGLDHVGPPALGVGAQLADLAHEAEHPAHVAQLELIAHGSSRPAGSIKRQVRTAEIVSPPIRKFKSEMGLATGAGEETRKNAQITPAWAAAEFRPGSPTQGNSGGRWR